MKRKLKTRRDTNREIIVAELQGRKGWTTFEKLSNATELNLREVMDVTGHEPYDIIGTGKGYKLISKASPDEVHAARRYLHKKIYAMRTRSEAILENSQKIAASRAVKATVNEIPARLLRES